MQNKDLISNSIYFFLSKKENKLTNKKENTYKLVINDFFVLNEIEIVKRIHAIINYKTHFYVFNKMSYTNISLIVDETTTTSKYLGSQQMLKEDKHILLEFGTEEIISLKEYLKALSSPRIYIYNIIKSNQFFTFWIFFRCFEPRLYSSALRSKTIFSESHRVSFCRRHFYIVIAIRRELPTDFYLRQSNPHS